MVAEPTFETEPIQTPPPKIGRVLSDTPAAKRARQLRADRKAGIVPKRRAKSARRTAARSGPKSLRAEIGAALLSVNTLVLMSPLGTRPPQAAFDHTIEVERIGDELDAAEIDALAGALDAQCRRSPRFRKYVETALGAMSGGGILAIVGIIAARRAARHGLAPAHLDFTLGLALGGAEAIAEFQGTPPPEPPDAVTGESEPARGPDTEDDDG